MEREKEVLYETVYRDDEEGVRGPGQTEQKVQHWPQVGMLTQLPATQNREESFILELNIFRKQSYLFAQEPPEPGSKG